jgi:DNA mismatch repair protein MutS2
LAPGQLWEIGRFMKAVHHLDTYLAEVEGEFPLLKAMGEGLVALPVLHREIINCVDEDGRVLNSASRELAGIRRKIAQTENNLRESLEAIIRSPATRKYLQDPIITTRGDRYVVPVKAEYRQNLKGIVHDRSASGATIFVEPLKTVELNNLIVRLKGDEEKEIERILMALAGKIARVAPVMTENYHLYCGLDFIFARGKLSYSLKAIEPSFLSDGEINILGGRHPLINEEAVVPIDLNIGGDFQSLVITGPNTGGKTVTLKTVGLFCYMAQSGLHIPADPGTKLSVFDNIFADIGDEQSIEQSLSTFSSHMDNIVSIISSLTGRSLVLLDELGAGTDPVEGAALAKALLSYFYRQGAITIATSHYSELKVFAFSHPGMQNASVEFDVETLAPTFRLLMGIPGKSNALAVAARLGLPEEVLAEARSIQKKDDLQIEDMLADLLKKQKEAEVDKEQLETLRGDAENYLHRARNMAEETEQRKSAILEKAREEALALITRARREVEEVHQELRKIKKEGMASAPWEKAQSLKESLRREQEGLYSKKGAAPTGRPLEKAAIIPGQRVYINSIHQSGTILDYHEESDEVNLQVGILKIKTKPHDLSVDGEGEGGKEIIKREFQKIHSQKARDIPLEIDLRGLTLSESMDLVEKYLDDSLLAGLERVRLIHGKGTGALRQGLQSYLDAHFQVASHRLGEQGEGGSGVTVVTLKK